MNTVSAYDGRGQKVMKQELHGKVTARNQSFERCTTVSYVGHTRRLGVDLTFGGLVGIRPKAIVPYSPIGSPLATLWVYCRLEQHVLY